MGCLRFQRLLFQMCHFIPVISAGYMALMDAETEGSKDGVHSHTVCLSYQPKFSEIAASPEEARRLPLVDLSDKLGCNSSDFSHPPINLSGSAVAVARGDCTFSTKADFAKSVKASSILIIDYKNSSQVPIPKGNGSQDYNDINITVASVAWKDYQDVISLPHPVEVKIYAIKSSHFDTNMILILLGSTSIIVIGSLSAAFSERRKSSPASPRLQDSSQDLVDSSSSSSSLQTYQYLDITPMLVLCWVVFLVAILLLLYFFYDYTVYFFIAMFCVAGSQGLYSCLSPLWSLLCPLRLEFPHRCLTALKIKSKVRVSDFFLLVVCFSIGIFWAIQRHASYAWIFQDILGTAFCITILKTLRLPSLKIITLVMVLLFFYDVFFVFITPLFTKNGESIMVDVATGGKGQHKEMIPLVFLVPLLNHHPAALCMQRSFSILGFGDVVLPGLLIAYNAVFDVRRNSKMVYLTFSAIGYMVGMMLCLVALVLMESGQPALFYLVPCTLTATYLVALMRGELRLMWTGEMSADKDNVHNDILTTEEEWNEEPSYEEQSPLMTHNP